MGDPEWFEPEKGAPSWFEPVAAAEAEKVVAPWLTPELPRDDPLAEQIRQRRLGQAAREALPTAELYGEGGVRKMLSIPLAPVGSFIAGEEAPYGWKGVWPENLGPLTRLPTPEGGMEAVPPESRDAFATEPAGRPGMIPQALANTFQMLTTGENLLILRGMGIQPQKLAALADVVKGAASGYFSVSMAKGTVESLGRAVELYQQGDKYHAGIALVEAGLLLPMVPAAGIHAKRHLKAPIDRWAAEKVEAELLERRIMGRAEAAEAVIKGTIEQDSIAKRQAPPPPPPPREGPPPPLEDLLGPPRPSLARVLENTEAADRLWRRQADAAREGETISGMTQDEVLNYILEKRLINRTPDEARAAAEAVAGPRAIPGPAEEAGVKAVVEVARSKKKAQKAVEAPPGKVWGTTPDGAKILVDEARVKPSYESVEAYRGLPQSEFVQQIARREEIAKRAREGTATPEELAEFPGMGEGAEVGREIERRLQNQGPPAGSVDRRAPEVERRVQETNVPVQADRRGQRGADLYRAELEYRLLDKSLPKAQRKKIQDAVDVAESTRPAETLARFRPGEEVAAFQQAIDAGTPLIDAANASGVMTKAEISGWLEAFIEDAVMMKGQVGRYRTVDLDGTEHWMGVKSLLPKSLQARKGYAPTLERRANILRRGMAGLKLEGKSVRFFEKAVDAAARRRGTRLEPTETLMAWLEKYESSLDPKLMEKVRAGLENAPREPIDPGYYEGLIDYFGQVAADERAALGNTPKRSGETDEYHTMQNGETIRKLAPPDSILEKLVRQLLPIGYGPQRAVDVTLKPLYDVQEKISVVRTDEKVSSTVRREDGSWEIRLPRLDLPYELLHEFFEIRRQLGQEVFASHDNSAIADRFVEDAIGPRWQTERRSVMEEAFGPSLERVRGTLAENLSKEDLDLLNSASAMGAGAFEYFGKKFASESLKPAYEGTVETLQHGWDTVSHWLLPARGVSERFIDDFGQAKAVEAKAMDHIMLNAFEKGWNRQWARMGRIETIANIDAFEKGNPLPNKKLRESGFQQFAKAMSDRIYDRLKPHHRDLQYREGWLSHIWKQKSLDKLKKENPRAYASLLGSEYWKHSRQFDRFKDGIAKGLEPVTWDGFELWKRGMAVEWRWATGMEVWKRMGDNGSRIFVPRGATPPPDWKPMDFDNRLRFQKGVPEGQERLPGMPSGGGNVAGQWYVEPNAYRLLENWLSRDTLRQAKSINWLIRMVNLDKAVTLAWPAFHTVGETLHSAGADMIFGTTRAAREFANLVAMSPMFDPKALIDGVITAASAPATAFVGPAVRRVMLARHGYEYWKDPQAWLESVKGKELLRKYPELVNDMELLYGAGLRVGGRESFWHTYIDSLRRSFANHDPVGGTVRAVFGAVPGLAAYIAGPTFRYYIPRLKLGAALMELQRARIIMAEDLVSGKLTEQTLARKVYESIENRFGEIEFDNWFWHKVTRTALQMMFLSPSWTGGDLKLAGVGATAQIKELKRALYDDPIAYMEKVNAKGIKGYMAGVRAPRLTYEAQALLSVLTVGSMTSAIIQKVMAGSYPWETDTPVKDFVYARTGAQDENGHPIRIALPGYESAYYVWLTHFFKHLGNAAAPMPRRIVEALANKKSFSGEEVWNPLDPLPKKIIDGLAYAAFGSYPVLGEGPFSYQQVKRLVEAGAPPVAIAFGVMGGRQAGKYTDETDGEEAIRTVHMRRLPSSRTPRSVQFSERQRSLNERIRNGADPEAAVLAAQDLPPARLRRVLQGLRKTQYQMWFESMGLDEALEVWGHLSADEKMRYRLSLRNKFMRARKGNFQGFARSEIPKILVHIQEALTEAVPEVPAEAEVLP